MDEASFGRASAHGRALFPLGYMEGMGFAEENADAELLGRRQQVVAQLLARLLYGIEMEVDDDE